MVGGVWQVLAAVPVRPGPRLWDPRLLWATLILAAALVVGGVIIALLDRWRKRSSQEPPSATDQLADFEELYEQGELSEKEFARIKARLSEELREELDLPEPPSTPEKEQKEPPPPGTPSSSPG